MSQALTQQDTRMQNHERLGHTSFKRIRHIDVKGILQNAERLEPLSPAQYASPPRLDPQVVPLHPNTIPAPLDPG